MSQITKETPNPMHNTLLDASKGVNVKKYPFKFLNSYTRDDKDIFFGRNEEVSALHEMIFQNNLLLIYGVSGTGKTSLINCGLAGKFKSHEWLSLNIRRENNINESLKKVLTLGAKPKQKKNESTKLDWLSNDFNDDYNASREISPIEKDLKTIYRKNFKPIFLIFDQFEELYILGTRAEQKTFFKSVKEILNTELPIKIIISIREEYLGYLDEFERHVPQLFNKKLRIEPMNLIKVKMVISNLSKLGESGKSIIQFKAGEDDAIATKIFKELSTKKRKNNTINENDTIRLPYLQVFLDKFYSHVTQDKDHKKMATFSLKKLNKMGNIDDVLRDFLDEQVAIIANKNSIHQQAIWQILAKLITDDGTKNPMSCDELENVLSAQFILDKISKIVSSLEKSSILRRSGEKQIFEIAHDALAKKIFDQRDESKIALKKARQLVQTHSLFNETQDYLSEKQLLFINQFPELKLDSKEKQYLEKSQEALEIKKRREKLRDNKYIIFTLFILIASLLFTTDSYRKTIVSKNDALDAKNDALKSEEKAIAALKVSKQHNKAFYYYKNKFALAYNNDKFYFIDKEGNEVTKLKKWDRCEQFNIVNGYANVQKMEDNRLKDFVLDTMGNVNIVVRNLLHFKANTIYLDLQYQSIKKNIPNKILKNKKLKFLILEGNSITNISKKISTLNKLSFLNLSRNEIEKIPFEFTQLSSLKSLNISQNKLKKLPNHFENLNQLVQLDLSYNQLTSLPDNFSKLPQLTDLDLSENPLENYKDLLTSVNKIKSLKSLKINNIPLLIDTLESLSSLSLLTKLEMHTNELNRLPKGISELGALINLDLHSNKLTELPENISKLSNLISLDLSFNNLKRLPENFSKLKKLETLNLSGNSLKKLPENISNLTNLKILDLTYTSIPKAVIKKIKKALPSCNIIYDLDFNKLYNDKIELIELDSTQYENWYNLSYYALFINKYDESITAAKKSYDINPKKNGVLTNLVAAYVLSNQWDKAKNIYCDWEDKKFNDQIIPCNKLFLKDIDQLQLNGITHPDFEQVKNIFTDIE